MSEHNPENKHRWSLPIDHVLKPLRTELDNPEPTFQGSMHTSMLLGADAYNDYFEILGYHYALYEDLGPGKSWAGDETYGEIISIIGDYVWGKAQEVGKNKFVLNDAS